MFKGRINPPPILKNKYTITVLIFGIWLSFFDQNNLWDRFQLSRRISQIKKQRTHYLEEIEQNQRKLKEIEESAESLEKFAREEYLMKKKNEDIFVIKEE